MLFYLILESYKYSYCMKDNIVVILQMRNPDLAGLFLVCLLIVETLAGSQFKPSSAYLQGCGFLTASKVPPKWEEGKKNGRKGEEQEEMYLELLKKKEANSNERD